MTDAELEEVGQIITTALMSFYTGAAGDRTARAKHIVQELEAHGWVLMKDQEDE